MLFLPIKSNTTSKCSKSIIFCHNILLGVWNDISINFCVTIKDVFWTLSVFQDSKWRSMTSIETILLDKFQIFIKNHIESKILIFSIILSMKIKIYTQYTLHINYNKIYNSLTILWQFEVEQLQKNSKKYFLKFFFQIIQKSKFLSWSK